MKNDSVKKLVTASLFAALACIATLVIQIPIAPTGGYVNLGDCVVLLCAWVLSPVWGMAAAGVGSMLADVISGYAYFAPATLVIKALMALAGGWIFRLIAQRGRRQFAACVVSAAVAETIMALGYCGFEYFILGLGSAALLGMPGNMIQAALGGVSATVVYLLLRRNHTLSDRFDRLS